MRLDKESIASLFSLLAVAPDRQDSVSKGGCGQRQAGFSLHVGITCQPYQKKKLKSLCRYITRPDTAQRRKFLVKDGNVVIALKTSYDHGTTPIIGISCSVQWHSRGAFRLWS
ncbi:MAG TPA: hypothetical protein DE147_00345 [Gammaproteobacteria bacterium]|nr:hypothetical protein [Gammaproteobacteria bacterium]